MLRVVAVALALVLALAPAALAAGEGVKVPEPIPPERFFGQVEGLMGKVLGFVGTFGFIVCMIVLVVGVILWVGGRVTGNAVLARAGVGAVIGAVVGVVVIEIAPVLVALGRGALK